MSEDLLLQFMHEAAKDHATPLISSISFLIPKKMIVLISLNRCGMEGVGLRELRKGENELSTKKEYFQLFKSQLS
jgi:hypothetical protein